MDYLTTASDLRRTPVAHGGLKKSFRLPIAHLGAAGHSQALWRGVLIYKEEDGPGGVNTLMAYRPATGDIYLGFTNSFGYFNEVDFMINNVIGELGGKTTAPNTLKGSGN